MAFDGLVRHDQTVMADPLRGDGHDRFGVPGDCARACFATVSGEHPSAVPHFAVYLDWLAVLRRWARSLGRDVVWASPDTLADFAGHVRHAVAFGPSPRGNFNHVVVVDVPSGRLVHDPHPSRAGIMSAESYMILWIHPLLPEPHQLQITS